MVDTPALRKEALKMT